MAELRIYVDAIDKSKPPHLPTLPLVVAHVTDARGLLSLYGDEFA